MPTHVRMKVVLRLAVYKSYLDRVNICCFRLKERITNCEILQCLWSRAWDVKSIRTNPSIVTITDTICVVPVGKLAVWARDLGALVWRFDLNLSSCTITGKIFTKFNRSIHHATFRYPDRRPYTGQKWQRTYEQTNELLQDLYERVPLIHVHGA